MITTTTLRPGQKGTKRFAEKYGDRLVRVRYKSDQEIGRRYITVELIEEEIVVRNEKKPDQVQQPILGSPRLGLRVEYWETDVREKIKTAGGIWRPRQKLWEMRYEDVVALGLESRVVGNISEY
jgi:hypothetical protein